MTDTLHHMKRLLCLFAHPDDESFGPGGSIAYWAQQGVEIHLLCATRGQVGHNDSDEDTGQRRERELRAAAQILGIKQVDLLDYLDGEIGNTIMVQLEQLFLKKIEAFQPDALLTFDLCGVSGHLDHIAVASAATQAFRHSQFPQELYYFCLGKAFTDAREQEYFVYFPDGYLDDQIDLTIDTTSLREVRRQARLAHVSQRADQEVIEHIEKTLPCCEHFRIRQK